LSPSALDGLLLTHRSAFSSLKITLLAVGALRLVLKAANATKCHRNSTQKRAIYLALARPLRTLAAKIA